MTSRAGSTASTPEVALALSAGELGGIKVPELQASKGSWIAAVLGDFDAFLSDHASCEKKASGMALSVAAHYPDRPRLLAAMVDLAVEELNHYREVMKLLLERKLTPLPDEKDPYVHALNVEIRRGTDAFLLDRLLVGAVVERRGAERFALIGDRVEDPSLARFYQAIAASEARHWTLFVDLAHEAFTTLEVEHRLAELSAAEARIMEALPARAALH